MKNSKLISGLAIFTAWALLVSLFVTAYISVEKNQFTLSRITANAINPPLNNLRQIESEEVQSHDNIRDCWLIIDGKVYDITSYIVSNKDRVESLESSCGKDMTEKESVLGLTRTIINDYYIGDVSQSIDNLNQVIRDANSNDINNSKDSDISLISDIDDKINYNNTNDKKDNNTDKVKVKKKYTLSKVANHDSKNDCWLIINTKVYDVTSYITSHPGGESSIASGCGKDATSMFETTGHSDYAKSLLKDYYIGDYQVELVAEQVNSNTQKNNNQNINNNSNSNKKFTLSQVSVHDNANDCYLIFSGKVYDVTSYLFSHPAGSAPILSYCGKDATAIYDSIDHSSYARSLLTAYYLGDIKSGSSTSNNNNENNNNQNNNNNNNQNKNDDDKSDEENDEDEKKITQSSDDKEKIEDKKETDNEKNVESKDDEEKKQEEQKTYSENKEEDEEDQEDQEEDDDDD